MWTEDSWYEDDSHIAFSRNFCFYALHHEIFFFRGQGRITFDTHENLKKKKKKKIQRCSSLLLIFSATLQVESVNNMQRIVGYVRICKVYVRQGKERLEYWNTGNKGGICVVLIRRRARISPPFFSFVFLGSYYLSLYPGKIQSKNKPFCENAVTWAQRGSWTLQVMGSRCYWLMEFLMNHTNFFWAVFRLATFMSKFLRWVVAFL